MISNPPAQAKKHLRPKKHDSLNLSSGSSRNSRDSQPEAFAEIPAKNVLQSIEGKPLSLYLKGAEIEELPTFSDLIFSQIVG